MGTIGSSSHLPGDIIAPVSKYCSTHESVLAVKSIVGETDSWGSETDEVCQKCLDEFLAKEKEQRKNPDPALFHSCETCGTTDATVKPTRDPEEGRAGPVYNWCSTCRKQVMDNFAD